MRYAVWLVALALVVGGVATFAASGGTDFGWFAYTPLEDGGVTGFSLSGNVVVWSYARVAGLAVAALGLVVLAAAVGYRQGRRAATR